MSDDYTIKLDPKTYEQIQEFIKTQQIKNNTLNTPERVIQEAVSFFIRKFFEEMVDGKYDKSIFWH